MNPLTLSPLGLLLAAAMSVTNVFTDVARKHALEKRDLIPATFWIRLAVTAVFAIALAVRIAGGSAVEIRDAGPLFGIAALHPPPVPSFLVYLVIDVSLITIVMWLYFRALQISPLSLCVPFLAFTPVFLIPTGFVLLGELPSPLKSLGVVLIVVGSLVMHRRLFAIGWTAPFKAVIREKGSRYMLLVSFIFSITNPLDKKLVVMSDVVTEAVSYGLGLCVTFFLLGKLQKADFRAAIRSNVKWVSLAGLSDAVSLLFQLASYTYLAVVITVSIKRAGIILAVAAGWLFFHEREITDKLIATAVMFCGVLILYLPLTTWPAIALTLLTLAGMSAALYFTRHESPAAAEVRS
jgi:drug/metabolite transporter (DMT)-like permease